VSSDFHQHPPISEQAIRFGARLFQLQFQQGVAPVIRNAMHMVLMEVTPVHPLSEPYLPGTLAPATQKIWQEAFDRILATGLDTNPVLRSICPGLVKIHDAKRAQEASLAVGRARAETPPQGGA